MKINVEQAAAFLRQMDNVVILCHKSPDGDTLGSGYGLLYGLRALGKRARLMCADPAPRYLCCIPQEDKEEAFTPDFVVAVDVADPALLGSLEPEYGKKVDLCIDHHPSNLNYAQYTLLEDTSAATCEIIFEVLQALKVELTPKIANCLYTGLATDTGCFKFSNTTARTHLMAAAFMEAGCRFYEINKAAFETVTQARLAVQQQALASLTYHFEGQCALMEISRDMMEQTGATEDDLEGLSALPRQIEGVEVGAVLRQNKERTGYKISMRTNQRVDASAVCSLLGGGGHKRAAGCTVEGELSQVRAKILEALQSWL